MIHKWDIVSNPNAADASIVYTLLIDGSENDAHLIIKKLEGYVQKAHAAAAPYAYQFVLSGNLDEATLKKIRVAVQEVVTQSQKMNEFSPNGTVGNPLFQQKTEKEEKKSSTFINLDPADSFTKPKETAIPPVPNAENLSVEVQSVQADELPAQMVQENTPIQDQDMLLQELENTAVGKQQPLDDIFLAETKYDMFVDVNKLTEGTAGKSAVQAPNAPDANTATTDAFNIFEQKIKDQTAFIDLADISSITERITKKDLNFVQHADISLEQKTVSAQAAAADASIEENTSEEALDPFEQLLAGNAPKPQVPAPEPSTAPALSAAAASPAAQNTLPPATPVPSDPTTKEQPIAQTIPPQAPVQPVQPAPDQPAVITENNSMNTENQEEPKTFLHLKLKNLAAAQKASNPVPPSPQTPATNQPSAQNQPPVPGRRRPSPVNTMLEKTHTIDHSIEVPLSELNQNKWSLEVPLIPTHTLENMTISINRFAHATAISVIDNPGKLYNPLVLHGPSGTGKTHFLHAIGYALSNRFGQENVFTTNGVRLSRGIQRYIAEGRIQQFEEFTSKMQALLIDDIHLISINEQNKTYLSKLLNDFRSQNKQIIITSKYPPENLAKLAELLNFQLDSGWISELKQANGPARMRIIQQMLSNNGLNISNVDVNRFFGHPHISLGHVARSIRQVRVLEKLIYPNTTVLDEQSTLNIFDQLLATKGEDQTSLISQKSPNDIHSITVTGKGEWGRIGFFYPQNHSNMMNWMCFALQQRAKELGISGGPELAVRSSYTTDNIISSAFKIANLCDNKKLKGAVILGPSADVCEPSVRDNFYDILTHMLEIMLIRCGVMNFEDAGAPSTFVKVLSELLR